MPKVFFFLLFAVKIEQPALVTAVANFTSMSTDFELDR